MARDAGVVARSRIDRLDPGGLPAYREMNGRFQPTIIAGCRSPATAARVRQHLEAAPPGRIASLAGPEDAEG